MKTKKIISTVLSAVILLTSIPMVAIASNDVDYTINSPYESVNWDTWNQYKASMHNHTWATDGKNDFYDIIEQYYALDYDILSITDHGTVDRSWTKVNTVPALNAVLGVVKRKTLNITPTGLTDERFEEITKGTDRGGVGMLRVPYGIEHNPTSFNNAHVNSWFVDWGHGVLGGTSDYETPIKKVDELGGVSVINHPGEYTSARHESDPELAYNSDYAYEINKFSTLLKKYPSCLGIDMNSKGDGRTKNDRKLWDILLQEVVPTGRNVLGIASADAHNDGAIDTGWIIACMPENTVDNLKSTMLTGNFFAGSRHIKNTKELAQLSSEIGYDLGTEWEAQRGTVQPKVKAIEVDDRADTITINAENALTVHWIADGEVIHVGNTIDLDDYSDQISCYVRAEIFGEGGILYSQPFTLEYDGAPTAQDGCFFDWGNVVKIFADVLLGVLGKSKLFSTVWYALTHNSAFA